MAGAVYLLCLSWVLGAVLALSGRPLDVECPAMVVRNGRVKPATRGGPTAGPPGGARAVRVRCIRGFRLFGEKEPLCVLGQWSAPPPACVKSGCSQVTLRAFKKGHVTQQLQNAVARFWCLPGYRLQGERLLVCDGRKWNGTVPSCQSAWRGPGVPPRHCAVADLGLRAPEQLVEHCGWTSAGFRFTATNATGGTGAVLRPENDRHSLLYSPEFQAPWSQHPCLRIRVRSAAANASLQPEGWVSAHERCGDEREPEALDVVSVESVESADSGAGGWKVVAFRVRPCHLPFQLTLGGLMEVSDVELGEADSCALPVVTTTEPPMPTDSTESSDGPDESTVGGTEAPAGPAVPAGQVPDAVRPTATARHSAQPSTSTAVTMSVATEARGRTSTSSRTLATTATTATTASPTPAAAAPVTPAAPTVPATPQAVVTAPPRAHDDVRGGQNASLLQPLSPTSSPPRLTAPTLRPTATTTAARPTSTRSTVVRTAAATTPTRPASSSQAATTSTTSPPTTASHPVAGGQDQSSGVAGNATETRVRTARPFPSTTAQSAAVSKTPGTSTTPATRTAATTTVKTARPTTAKTTPTITVVPTTASRVHSTASSTTALTASPTVHRAVATPTAPSPAFRRTVAKPVVAPNTPTTARPTAPSVPATPSAVRVQWRRWTSTTPATSTSAATTATAATATPERQVVLVANRAPLNATAPPSTRHTDARWTGLGGVLPLCAGLLLLLILGVAAAFGARRLRGGPRAGRRCTDGDACTLTAADDLGLHFIDLQPAQPARPAPTRNGAPGRAGCAPVEANSASAAAAMFRVADNSVNIGARSNGHRKPTRAAPVARRPDKDKGRARGRGSSGSEAASLLCDEHLDFTERHPADEDL